MLHDMILCVFCTLYIYISTSCTSFAHTKGVAVFGVRVCYIMALPIFRVGRPGRFLSFSSLSSPTIIPLHLRTARFRSFHLSFFISLI